ncbi:hypothetical protein QWY96_15725 [Vibrio artabrorum]|uniref:Uncharacterized protein n=1 Tax=Vibrio artabrorum TaxID=446374 RepID=A0ABT8CM72_9VIBR|nr:hypothetical protein [Vibrio artabrorum]MDN3701982.1 hypothetical protein [Vibrio artabrorum]
MKKYLSVAFILFSFGAQAGFCSMQLKDEANVFKVNCALDRSFCNVTGYFSDSELEKGFKGVVATFQKTPEAFRKLRSSLRIDTFRSGEYEFGSPPGYFAALEQAEKMMLGEASLDLVFLTLSPVRELLNRKWNVWKLNSRHSSLTKHLRVIRNAWQFRFAQV